MAKFWHSHRRSKIYKEPKKTCTNHIQTQSEKHAPTIYKHNLWVLISSTDKVSNSWIRDLGVQSLSAPNTDWYLSLLIKFYHQEQTLYKPNQVQRTNIFTNSPIWPSLKTHTIKFKELSSLLALRMDLTSSIKL